MLYLEAKEILAEYIEPDGSLGCSPCILSWEPGNDVVIDGHFSEEQIKAISVYISNTAKLTPRKKQPVKKKEGLTPSEALFGFVGWLTSRRNRVVLSKKDSVGIVPSLISDFCNVNNLDEPRLGWSENLKYPE